MQRLKPQLHASILSLKRFETSVVLSKWVQVLISNINIYRNITGQSYFFGACVLEKQEDNQIRLYKIRFGKKKADKVCYFTHLFNGDAM